MILVNDEELRFKLAALDALFTATNEEGLKANERLVLLHLTLCSNKYLETYIPYEDLSKLTGIAERTLRTLVKSLVDSGWLDYFKGNSKYANAYQVKSSKLAPHARFYIAPKQSPLVPYKNGKRTKPAIHLGLNAISRPFILRERDDIEQLTEGTYFIVEGRGDVYLWMYTNQGGTAEPIYRVCEGDRIHYWGTTEKKRELEGLATFSIEEEFLPY